MDYAELAEMREEVVTDFEAVDFHVRMDHIVAWKLHVPMRPWGHCKYMGRCRDRFIISLSDRLCNGGRRNAIMNVIAHELVHTLFPYDHHGGGFKRAAARLNDAYDGKYDISRLMATRKVMTIEEACNAYRYVIRCKHCGAFWGHMKACGCVTRTMDYHCGSCKSNDLERVK